MAARARYFSPSEQEMLMDAYEEVKEQIKKKGNTATVIKQRERAWQSIADRLNALNMPGPKRTWQQVKVKYKNILQNAVKKKKTQEDADPGEGTSAAASAGADGDYDDETISLDSRRLEDPDAVLDEGQPGNINSKTIRHLYATHLKRQIQLAEVDMALKKRKMEDLLLDSEIKRRTIKKLDLEIKELERDLQEDKRS